MENKKIKVFHDLCLQKYKLLKEGNYKKSNIITIKIENIQKKIDTDSFINIINDIDSDFIKLEAASQLLTRDKVFAVNIIKELCNSKDNLVKNDADVYLKLILPKLKE